MNSIEVAKYERTKAEQAITLPSIATSRKPYLLASAETNGPEEDIWFLYLSPDSVGV